MAKKTETVAAEPKQETVAEPTGDASLNPEAVMSGATNAIQNALETVDQEVAAESPKKQASGQLTVTRGELGKLKDDESLYGSVRWLLNAHASKGTFNSGKSEIVTIDLGKSSEHVVCYTVTDANIWNIFGVAIHFLANSRLTSPADITVVFGNKDVKNISNQNIRDKAGAHEKMREYAKKHETLNRGKKKEDMQPLGVDVNDLMPTGHIVITLPADGNPVKTTFTAQHGDKKVDITKIIDRQKLARPNAGEVLAALQA